jgi:hypothetical protein
MGIRNVHQGEKSPKIEMRKNRRVDDSQPELLIFLLCDAWCGL